MTTSAFNASPTGTVRLGYSPAVGWLERSDSSWGNARAFAAISRDGQVSAWGDAAKGGQLDGATAALLTRQTGVPWIWTVELAASSGAFAARRANGQVVAWGDSTAGGAIPSDLAATLKDGVVRVFGLAQGFAALKSDGRLITWGPGPGKSQQASGLNLNQPYQVFSSADSLAILQADRLVGCWGGAAGASQWAQHAELRNALSSGVLELVCSDAGFAARTASGQVITWGVPNVSGDASGLSISQRPDITRLGSGSQRFDGFDAQGQIYEWVGADLESKESTPFQAGVGPLKFPYPLNTPIQKARRMTVLPYGDGIGLTYTDSSTLRIWKPQNTDKDKSLFFDTTTDQEPIMGLNGLATVKEDKRNLYTFGASLDLTSPNATGFFSTSSKPADATWQAVRTTGSAFAALASDGHVALWGNAAKGASPANPSLTQQLLLQNPAKELYSNQGAFAALRADGTAISWGQAGTGGDQSGSPQLFTNLDHLVSPWANVRIDEQGPASQYTLIVNGEANPDGQAIPILVREGDRLSVEIKNDPNGDRSDTTDNQYLWQHDGKTSGAGNQASINLDALSTGTWSVTPTYLDLPGFAKTLAPLSAQVQMVDNGQASVSISPSSFNGPSDQAFSAGNGKVSELLATFAGDPEGVRSIEAVQWFRNDTPIPSAGTPARSILQAKEPGSYSFEATYTDTQGYQRTIHSGRVQIDPAGSVPNQSQLATGGLQTLWRLAEDGRSVERLNSASLRMRPVDMAGTPGYLAISAASDGRAWALDNDGYPCLYDAPSNRFLRQDGSDSDAGQRMNLGNGWRQIVAARGSNTAPALWLLRDAPLDGSGNVAYLPGALAEGQTLADLKPIPLTAGPQLRLLAVGDDQTPWGIDNAGNLWCWDAASNSFGDAPLAAGVGSQIRQLQMSDQGQVWGLDDKGVLQMWNSENKQFTPVPFDSPFFTQRSAQLIAGVIPTWESFSLSPAGGFVGVPRSGVTKPAGGTGLVSFDTSEISRQRDPSEAISQLQLLAGTTLQDNGEIEIGQNLAFNLNNQVHVAYMLNASKPGQWEGAATVPMAQSGTALSLESQASRDEKGVQRPVIQLHWNSSLKDNASRYKANGFISPFGGLIVSAAEPEQSAEPPVLSALSPSPALTGSSSSISPFTAPLGIGSNAAGSEYPLAGATKNPLKWPISIEGGATTGASFSFFYNYEKQLTKKWKSVSTITATFSNDSHLPNSPPWDNTGWDRALGVSINATQKFAISRRIQTGPLAENKLWKLRRDDSPLRRIINIKNDETYKDQYEDLVRAGGLGAAEYRKKIEESEPATFRVLPKVSLQTDWSFLLGDPYTITGGINTSYGVSFVLPFWTPGGGLFQLCAEGGLDFKFGKIWDAYHGDNNSEEQTSPPIQLTTKDGTPISKNTQLNDIVAIIDTDNLLGGESNPTSKFMEDIYIPAYDLLQDFLLPMLSLLNGKLFSARPDPQSDLLRAIPELNLLASNPSTGSYSADTIGTTQMGAPDTATKPLTFTGKAKTGYLGVIDTGPIYLNIRPSFTFVYSVPLDESSPGGWSGRAQIEWEMAILNIFNWHEEFHYDFPIGSRPLSSSSLAGSTLDRYILNTGKSIDAIESASLDDNDLKDFVANPVSGQGNSSLLASTLNGNQAIGIYRYDSSGTNEPLLFELGIVKGVSPTKRLDEVTWDWSTAQKIDGSKGITTKVDLVTLADGSLAVAASHLDAGDPLLTPIIQLAPGQIFHFQADPGTQGKINVLDTNSSTLGLPSDRYWAQLGSSLASSPALRPDWSGDSLISGASGSNDGAGALSIINGQALAGLQDLSSLENNKNSQQGLVILGSHRAGSHSGLGQQVINGGDTNADGFSDIFASAPNDLDGRGQVYMFYGGRALELLPNLKSGSITLDDLDALQAGLRADLYLKTFEGIGASKGYGTILAGGQDLNGDGKTDPLIGYKADSSSAGAVELWSSRSATRQKLFRPQVLEDTSEQSIPDFDRSLLVSSRSSQPDQSDFRLQAAASVGDLNSDGYGDIVISSDNKAALVFGSDLMPVYWQASALLGGATQAGDPAPAAPLSQTWTASWRDASGKRTVLSFAGADRNGDGLISTDSQGSKEPELDWLALRQDDLASPDNPALVALSPEIAGQWSGALQIKASSLSFNVGSQTFTAPISLRAADSNGNLPFSWGSNDAGVSLDQAARSLRARLLTSQAPGVVRASGIGDFNGDGRTDLALSQSGFRVLNEDGSGLVSRPGQTTILYGKPSLADSTTSMALEQNSNGVDGVRLNFGGELTAIGDWNNDRKADVLIRDPFAAEQTGSQVLLNGRDSLDDGLLDLEQERGLLRAQIIQGNKDNTLTGASAAAGDFAADGNRSLMIGAPNTLRESDVRQAGEGLRVLTATQNADGTWNAPQKLPDFDGVGAGLQQLSSYTAVGQRILATWVHNRVTGPGQSSDELWAAFQDPSSGQWTPAHLLQSNQRGDASSPSINQVKALALTAVARDSNGNAIKDQQGNILQVPTGGVLLAWTLQDPATSRTFLFQSTYDPAASGEDLRWSVPKQQDPNALLLANQDAISSSQLKLQLNPGTAEQRSQIWAETSLNGEEHSSAAIKLYRSGDLSQPLTLSYSTRDRSASAGSQYQDSAGSVTFAAGASAATVTIPLIDNQQLEYRTTEFVVDFQLNAQQSRSAQLLLGDAPVATTSAEPMLSVGLTIQDNDVIKMRAIDAGISLDGPLTDTTGTTAAASTSINSSTPNQNLANTIALIADPGANEGLGQVYGLFVAATTGSKANPGMDWKELNDITWLDQPVAAKSGDERQLNVLIQPGPALAALDPRAGFGTAIATLNLGADGDDIFFAISAPGNPLDASKPGQVYIVAASVISDWAKNHNPKPLILDASNSLIIKPAEQSAANSFGSVLATARLDTDQQDELVIGTPGLSQVTVISGAQIYANRSKGSVATNQLLAKTLTDSNSNPANGNTTFGSAITALDLDDDGAMDLAIGASNANPVRFENTGPVVAHAGAVHILKGTNNLNSFDGDIQKLKDVLHINGYGLVNERGETTGRVWPINVEEPTPGSFGFGEALGSALAAVDLNSDKCTDLAMGAPQYTPNGSLRTGRVVTWFGRDSGAVPWGQTINLQNSLPREQGVSFVGLRDGGQTGASLAAVGDLQTDGNEDLAIGSPFEGIESGRVDVAFGSKNRYDTAALEATGTTFYLDPNNPDSPFQTFEAPPGYRLGQSVVGLGDVNNDSDSGIGGMDLFLGSPAAITAKETTNDKGDLQYTAAGQTHLAWGRPWLGANQSLDVPFTQGVGYLLPFGGVPLALGDMNGDGYGDYALLGSSDDAGGATPAADASKLRIRFGAAVEYEQQQVLLSNFDLTPAKTTAADDSYPLVATGDVDGDSFGDLIALTKAGLRVLLGAPNLSVQGDSQGQWDTAGEPLTVPGTNKPISLLSSGDFDGDGFDDVVVVNQNALITGVGATLTVFWGSAQGLQPGGQQTLTDESGMGGTPIVSGLIALDSNGDGTDELAMSGDYIKDGGGAGSGLKLLALDRQAANPFGRTLQWLQGDLFSATVPTALSSGDINGDGYSDLLIDQDGKRLALFCGDQKAYLKRSIQSFSRSQAPGPNIQRTQLAKFIDDVNADGRDDLLFSPTSTQDFKSSSPYKRGPYSYIYLGSHSKNNITIPTFWDQDADNDHPNIDRIQGWASHGYVIESLPGEAAAYRTGSIGDVNGDGFAETLFSSNRLLVGGKAEPRPHSIAIYGAAKLSTEALSSTTSNDGSSSDDALHQLGSAGKQELLMRGKAGSDLLQVHADPYGATLSIPDDGDNAGRLTVSASNGTTLWSQPRNTYELVLKDGQLQIIHHADSGDEIIQAWGQGINAGNTQGGNNGSIDRLYLDPGTGWLYGMDADQAYLLDYRDVFANPDSSSKRYAQTRRGFSINTGFYIEQGFPSQYNLPSDTLYGQLIFFPESGKLALANRGKPDLKNSVKINTDVINLYPGDGPLKGKERYTQVLYPGESLLSEAGARRLSSAGQTAAPMLSFNQLQASRSNLSTFLTPFSPSDSNGNTFGVKRIEPARGYTKDLKDVLGDQYSQLQESWAWVAPADAAHNNQGPLVAVMDGNGRLTLNAQQVVEKQIKPGSELAVLHPGNPDPFLPPTGNVPVLIKPDTPSDQVSQQVSRSTNNTFTAVLKGGLDDDRLGIDSLDRFRSRDGQPAGLVDGGSGVDTLFFSSQSSDRQDPVINLVGFGSRIRNIEVIEIPINNTLEIDEAPLLNTSLHRLLIKSRGNAAVTFHVRTAYQYIGDQLDAGIAYSVWSKPNSNLQLWVQQGRVNLTQQRNAPGTAASLASRSSRPGESLSAGTPIDADGLPIDAEPAYRWYRDGRLIAGATDAVYGAEVLQTLEPGLYVRETDYTDRVGLRQSVTSAPLVVDPARPVTGGTLRLRHTSLDTRQQDRLATPQDGLQPASELLFADFKAKAGARAPGVQRLPLQPSSPSTTGSGLVSLVSGDGQPLWDSAPGSADPYAPGVFDLNGDGRIDTITWQPRPGGDSSLEATLLASTRPASLIGTADGLLGIALDGETLRSSPAALQSVGISLLQLPQTPVALVAIPLAPGETLAGLTPDQRRQRALTLLGSVSGNTPIPMSAAEPNRSLWLPTDQILALLELRGTTPQDWDGASDWQRLELQPTSGAESSLEFRSPSGLAITITSEDAPQDLNGLVARSQTSQPLLDFRSLQGLRLSGTVSVARDSSFNSRLGFYAVDTLQGEIRDPVTNALVAPGEPGYASLAKRMRVKSLDGLKARDQSTRTQAINLRAAGLLAPFAIVKDPQHGKTKVFAYAQANSDGRSPFTTLGNNSFGFSADPSNSRSDFNDLTFNLQLHNLG